MYNNNFNSLFDDFFDAFSTAASTHIPPVDVYEMEEGYFIDVELPGYSNEDVDLKIDNHTLSILTSSKFNKALESKKEEIEYLVRETNSKKSFKRSFSLPKDVDENAIDAKFNNGLLSIKIPKLEKKQPKNIEIRIQ